jgi:hypothetical protein
MIENKDIFLKIILPVASRLFGQREITNRKLPIINNLVNKSNVKIERISDPFLYNIK